MSNVFIPTEEDMRKWIKVAIKESLEELVSKNKVETEAEEELLNRKEIAKRLKISLVTLTDWVKRGLPSHKQRGRVYFLYPEVMDYIKQNRPRLLLP